ncbi:hypothetical protein FACS1894211_04050 [Clostridia bacterium]|nr:hypothetical protein FACS1894211_04050 [Clostridia bacterium]
MLTDEVIAEIACLTADALEKERRTECLTRLDKKLSDNKKAIDALLNTLALGRSPELILDKIDCSNFLTRIRDFTVKENDIKAKALFVDIFIYKVFYHNDETLTIPSYLNERTQTLPQPCSGRRPLQDKRPAPMP